MVHDQRLLVEASIVSVFDLGEGFDSGIGRIEPEPTQVHVRTSKRMDSVGRVVVRCRSICAHQSLPTEIQQASIGRLQN